MNVNRKVYQYAEPNLTMLGWLGVVGFPLYYVVWEFLFPQPYENLALRLFCSLCFTLLILRDKWPKNLKKYKEINYLFTVTLGLPFFFFYMLLMNDWSYVWVLSFMSAMFLHILLVHITWLLIVQALIAMICATLLAWLTKGDELVLLVEWQHLPIFLFVYIFGSACYSRNQGEHESKVSIAKSFGAGIAHEMRNPLSCLYTSIDLIHSTLPRIQDDLNHTYVLSRDDLLMLRSVSEEASNIIYSGNETIDLLLTSIDENRVSQSTFRKYSVEEVVVSAIDSFGYQGTLASNAVKLHVQSDFRFLGSDTLLKYVMYNLFKNAFHHRKSEPIAIEVTLVSERLGNYILVEDNGVGMEPDVLQHIYEDFYTTGQSGHYGLGLPFCKKVMTAFGGEIRCESTVGVGTRFSLKLPPLGSQVSEKIMADLATFKTVLMITDRDHVASRVCNVAKQLGFNGTMLSTSDTLRRKEYEFEFDLIVVDVMSFSGQCERFKQIKPLFSFTDARVAYFYSDDFVTNRDSALIDGLLVDDQIRIQAVEWDEHLLETIESLLFEPIHQRPIFPETIHRNLDNYTVMIVDDNASLRKLTAIMLEKQGFKVIEKANGQEAIDELKARHVDLILMDIEMPVMDGIEATRAIRMANAVYSSIPIIAFTGDSTALMLDKQEASGMTDYISKPVDSHRLVEKLLCWL
ncbi:response regulator [Vibrio sp. FNV 38]|nr:response regulator [Vibrio sp. FNV 38]